MFCRCWHYLEIHVIEFLCNYARLWVPVGAHQNFVGARGCPSKFGGRPWVHTNSLWAPVGAPPISWAPTGARGHPLYKSTPQSAN